MSRCNTNEVSPSAILCRAVVMHVAVNRLHLAGGRGEPDVVLAALEAAALPHLEVDVLADFWSPPPVPG